MSAKIKTLAPLTLDGNAQQLTSSKIRTDQLIIYAEEGNSAEVRVGDANVVISGGSERGIPIKPGVAFKMSIEKEEGDEADIFLNEVYVRGTASDKVQILYTE